MLPGNCARCRIVPSHQGLSTRRNPHRRGTTAVPIPRFRALALLGRRPQILGRAREAARGDRATVVAASRPRGSALRCAFCYRSQP
jgi:hypothetical protein